MSENLSSTQNSQIFEAAEAQDLKKILYRYLRYWPVFLISAILFIAGARIYLRYTPNIYTTSGKIKILKEQEGLDMSSLQGGSTFFDFSKVNLANETEILKSRRINEKVIEKLGLQTIFYRQGTIKKYLIWKEEIPFEIIWDLDNETTTPWFELRVIDQNKFLFTEPESEFSKTYQFGELIQFNNYSFRILVKEDVMLEKDDENLYLFKHEGFEKAISNLTNKIDVEIVGETSEILSVSIKGENRQKNEDIINNIINQFNDDGVQDNRKMAKQTEAFAAERLEFLYRELDTVDANLVDFKTGSNIVTIETTASELFTKNAEAEAEAFRVANELLIVDAMKERLSKVNDFRMLPANIGSTGGEINLVIEKYNELISARERILVTSPEESIVIQKLNGEISSMRETVIRTIEIYKSNLEASKSKIDEKERITRSGLTNLPEKEKRIREITREQLIKERLFLFLLQKREEAALSAAVVADISKVVDFAYTDPSPISPRPAVVMLGSLFVSLFLPFSVLFLMYLINTKINEKSEIRAVLPNISIAGEIPLVPKNDQKIVAKNSNNTLAEGFRILRTNLNFLGLDKNKSKVVFVTSTIKGEGKTFVSVNLAATLSLAEAKCLLIGGDLRNPQIHNVVNLDKNRTGLSKYLYDDTTKFEEIIIKRPINEFNLDIVLSGEIPPNPTELLISDRFGQFLEEAKNMYDYVVVDTAPTLLVTDTLLISKFADISLYTVRANYTDFELLDHLKEIKNGNKLKNIGVVLNGVENARGYAYNYGYGYGYNAEKVKKRSKLRFW